MTTIRIKHRYTNVVLFECEAPEDMPAGLHVRHALEQAVAINASLNYASLNHASLNHASLDGASLDGVSLDGASLRGASLKHASLDRASLRGASLLGGEKVIWERPVFSIGPIGSRQDTLMSFTTDQGLRLKTGCFFGSLQAFRSALIAEHSTNVHREEYESALLLIEKHAALWPGERP